MIAEVVGKKIILFILCTSIYDRVIAGPWGKWRRKRDPFDVRRFQWVMSWMDATEARQPYW